MTLSFLGLFLLAAPSMAQVGENLGLLNPNLASSDELAAVPGLNNTVVEEILAARPFLSMLEFHEAIEGHVSESTYDQLYGALWVPIDLNDVTNEEILLIPGVGNRMLHEFEEYRPYIALPEFHREIGKYVDDEELARLAQYVYVRIDLNSASEAEILSIPGVGPRMQHEFEEYRPYAAMAQFSREIGKYVDDEEVDRLARYVEIR
jgi:radical SAM superfamily enzyme with C-terminal helix-hairpin-helix motif